MKKIVVLLGVLISLTAARISIENITEGVITYETKINMHRTLPPDRAEMKSMVPEYRTMQNHLIFNSSESLYKPVEEEQEEEDMNSDHGMRVRLRTPQNEVYLNRDSRKIILLQEFMGKNFLINDSLKIPSWKLGTDTREIQGYKCLMATYYNEERKQNIMAWYTDQLPPFLGPESFNTLPGTVLLVDINDGERVISAVAIERRAPAKNELRTPNKGEKTTPADFRKFVTEQTERMRANGANVIIRN